MTPKQEYDALMTRAMTMGVRIVPKQGWFWNALAWLVKVFTFGKNRDFLDGYITTVYKTIGVPKGWDSWHIVIKLEILTHELTHVEQLRKWTPPGFFLCYLLFPLPLGLAWCRYRLEREAYLAGYKVLLRYQKQNWTSPYMTDVNKVAYRTSLIDEVVDHLSGPGYGWSWFKGPIRKWFEANLPK